MSKRLFIAHKPCGILSQFHDEGNRQGWGQLAWPFPSDVYSIGRLDADSEGLLLFTNDNDLKTRLLDPEQGHERTYHAQLDGQITPEAIRTLELPMNLNIQGKSFLTRGCRARLISPEWHPRTPPIRTRKNIPTSWIEITLCEGKNRQVRRMTAAIGHPTLRLIRVSMGSWHLDGLQPGVLERIKSPGK